MSAETEHNEHLDLFSLKIRQKLEDHRLPVNMEGWEQIEAKVAAFFPLEDRWLGNCYRRCSCLVTLDPSLPDRFCA